MVVVVVGKVCGAEAALFCVLPLGAALPPSRFTAAARGQAKEARAPLERGSPGTSVFALSTPPPSLSLYPSKKL